MDSISKEKYPCGKKLVEKKISLGKTRLIAVSVFPEKTQPVFWEKTLLDCVKPSIFVFSSFVIFFKYFIPKHSHIVEKMQKKHKIRFCGKEDMKERKVVGCFYLKLCCSSKRVQDLMHCTRLSITKQLAQDILAMDIKYLPFA